MPELPYIWIALGITGLVAVALHCPPPAHPEWTATEPA